MRRLLCLATLLGLLLSTHTLAEKSDLTGHPNLWMNVTALGEAVTC